MMIAIVPIIAAVVGLVVYALASTEKPKEIGRALMWCGFLITLLVVAHFVVKVG